MQKELWEVCERLIHAEYKKYLNALLIVQITKDDGGLYWQTMHTHRLDQARVAHERWKGYLQEIRKLKPTE